MSKSFEYTAKTSEDAIEAGLKELGVAITDVEVQVVEEGSKGLFGLFGSRPAKVRLTLREEKEDDLVADLFRDETPPKPRTRPVKKPEAPQESKPAAPRPQPVAQSAKPAEEAEAVKEPPVKEKPVKPAPVQRTPKTKKQPKENRETQASKPLPPKQPPVKAMEKPEVIPVPDDEIDPESAAGKARAFILELTRLMGAEVAVAMGKDAEGNLYANITGDEQGMLIGRRGETLDAVQYLTSLRINRNQENYTRITIDTENYRARREDTLIRLANRKANQVVRSGRRVSLEPMNPYERRIIHSALQPNEQVDTHSEGEEPNRRVVITLRK